MSARSGTDPATWAKKRRAVLIAQLGGKCAQCGSTELLEFNHIFGRDWKMEKKSRWQRLAIIAREIEAGEINLLCRSCNASDGHNHKRKGLLVNALSHKSSPL